MLFPPWVHDKKYCNRVILLRKKNHFYYYDAMIQRLFLGDLSWEASLDRLVFSRKALDKFIETSEDILGNFVCITDTGFNLICHSKKILPPSECTAYQCLLKDKCYNEKTIEFFENSILSQIDIANEIVLCGPHDGCPYETLHYPIYISNSYLFHVTMVCAQGHTDYLYDIFSKFASRIELACNDFWDQAVNIESAPHRLLHSLICEETMSENYFKTQMEVSGLNSAKQFKVAYIEFPIETTIPCRSAILEASRSLNQGMCFPFMYDNNIVILIYSLSDNDSALSGHVMLDTAAECIYDRFGLKVGMSQRFTNIRDMHLAYQQALIAYSLRELLEKEYQLTYDEKFKPVCPFDYALKYYLLSDDCDSRIVDFSFKDSVLERILEEDNENDTQLVKILWVYLTSERNATETAKRVFLHRNTVLYHIARLEKRFGITLDSPLTRDRITLDYRHDLMKRIDELPKS